MRGGRAARVQNALGRRAVKKAGARVKKVPGARKASGGLCITTIMHESRPWCAGPVRFKHDLELASKGLRRRGRREPPGVSAGQNAWRRRPVPPIPRRPRPSRAAVCPEVVSRPALSMGSASSLALLESSPQTRPAADAISSSRSRLQNERSLQQRQACEQHRASVTPPIALRPPAHELGAAAAAAPTTIDDGRGGHVGGVRVVLRKRHLLGAWSVGWRR